MNAETRPAILIVEDENVVAMDLVSTLEKLRYPVADVVGSGEDAIAAAQLTTPGLVLMDIHLRGHMDGISAAEQIQQRFLIPVVYLTAYSDEATLDRARITYPFGYILKPFEDREIEVAIQTALYRHKMELALRASERRLQAVLTGIGDAVIATDTERRITFLNHAAEALVGWTSERARGRLLSDVLKATSLGDGLFRLSGTGKDAIAVEISESTLFDPSGKTSGFVTVARDVSERLRAQEAHDRELVERAARATAERDHERARLKSEISLLLTEGVAVSADTFSTLKRVADLIARSLGTWCVLHIADGDGSRQILAHEDPAKASSAEELHRRWPSDPISARGSDAVIRTGRPEWMGQIPDDLLVQAARDAEHLEVLRRLGPKSYVCVPLRVRQRIIGALTLASDESTRPYREADIDFAQQLADRIALALDNARLYREAQDAKTKAERLYEAADRARAEAEALFRVADAISEVRLDQEAIVQRVTDEVTALVGAQFGAFFYNVVTERGDPYRLYILSGVPREAFQRFGLPRNTPLFAATFAGHGVVRSDNVREDPRYGKLAPHHGLPEGHPPVTSYLAVPVVARTGSVLGGLFFGHQEPGRFTERHERMAKALAAHAAVAIDNARLFEDMRAAEERQSRLVAELERAVRFSEMFLGILGHDLRNPLSGITTAASLVVSRADSDRITKPIRRILSSADRMSRMIDQLLDFTSVRLGQGIPLQRKAFDLAETCRQVLDEVKSEGEHIGLTIRGDAVGSWDEDRLAQLLSNLAGNALQHRQPGTPVAVSVDGSARDRVTLTVENKGTIPAELLPVIFEPLRGGQTRKTAGSSGLGLGLYISQQIIAAHGGSIRVDSDEAQGSTRFTVDLPRTPPGDTEQVFAPGDEVGSR